MIPAMRRWSPSSKPFHIVIRPVILCCGLLLWIIPVWSARDRAGAKRAYEKALEMETALAANGSTPARLDELRSIINTYYQVLTLDPVSAFCDNALWNAAQLCRQAHRLAPAAGYLQRGLNYLDWLIREYPASSLRDDAYWLKGCILQDDLGDRQAAHSAWQELLRVYPRSPHAAGLKSRLQETPAPEAAVGTGGEIPVRASIPEPVQTARSSPGDRMAAMLLDVRFWSTGDYTRVVMDFDHQVTFTQNEVDNPYRIFIDFNQTLLGAALKGKTFSVGDTFLDRIRLGQNREDVVRVVLDFHKKGISTVFTLADPFRVVIDIRDQQAMKDALERKNRLAGLAARPPEAKPQAKPPASAETKKTAPPEAPATVTPKPDSKAAEPPAEKPAAAPPAGGTDPAPSKDGRAAANPPATGETAGKVPEPTSDGRRTLTRILGLKVGKILLDPGHGGKDTGSIGFNGIKEKDVTLSMALELKKELQSQMNLDVILTRDSDVFVPLEQRTAMANLEKVDLFISIHANASRNKGVGGIETFFLGLTRDPHAQLIAAYENATSQQNLAQLEDVIKKITLYEKAGESRDFAQKVHQYMLRSLRTMEPNARNRGVKQAPFVVLIGTNVPSILLEMGFISNRKEAEIISLPEKRQKLTAGILRGIEEYLSSLGTLARVLPENPPRTDSHDTSSR